MPRIGPLLRRLVEGIAVVAVALAGVIALLVFLEGRDASTAGDDRPAAVSGPGIADRSADSSLLKAGNVELRYSRREDRNALVAFAEREAGPDTTELRDVGLAIVVRYDRRASPTGALAFGRRLEPTSAADPRLQAFVESWLGKPR